MMTDERRITAAARKLFLLGASDIQAAQHPECPRLLVVFYRTRWRILAALFGRFL